VAAAGSFVELRNCNYRVWAAGRWVNTGTWDCSALPGLDRSHELTTHNASDVAGDALKSDPQLCDAVDADLRPTIATTKGSDRDAGDDGRVGGPWTFTRAALCASLARLCVRIPLAATAALTPRCPDLRRGARGDGDPPNAIALNRVVHAARMIGPRSQGSSSRDRTGGQYDPRRILLEVLAQSRCERHRNFGPRKHGAGARAA